MTRDLSVKRHPRTRHKDRQDAKPTARGTTTRPGRTTCVKTDTPQVHALTRFADRGLLARFGFPRTLPRG
jgi:hypothetical protein